MCAAQEIQTGLMSDDDPKALLTGMAAKVSRKTITNPNARSTPRPRLAMGAGGQPAVGASTTRSSPSRLPVVTASGPSSAGLSTSARTAVREQQGLSESLPVGSTSGAAKPVPTNRVARAAGGEGGKLAGALPESTNHGDETEAEQFAAMTLTQLRAVCEERQLPKSGTKAQLVARLLPFPEVE